MQGEVYIPGYRYSFLYNLLFLLLEIRAISCYILMAIKLKINCIYYFLNHSTKVKASKKASTILLICTGIFRNDSNSSISILG